MSRTSPPAAGHQLKLMWAVVPDHTIDVCVSVWGPVKRWTRLGLPVRELHVHAPSQRAMQADTNTESLPTLSGGVWQERRVEYRYYWIQLTDTDPMPARPLLSWLGTLFVFDNTLERVNNSNFLPNTLEFFFKRQLLFLWFFFSFKSKNLFII